MMVPTYFWKKNVFLQPWLSEVVGKDVCYSSFKEKFDLYENNDMRFLIIVAHSEGGVEGKNTPLRKFGKSLFVKIQ